MNRELKLCPFCGGEANAVRSSVAGVCAVVCNCASHVFYGAEADMGKTIAAWNTRAERTCRMEWDEDSDGEELYPVGHVTCSACGAWLYAVNTMRFCPNCGAKVVEE